MAIDHNTAVGMPIDGHQPRYKYFNKIEVVYYIEQPTPLNLVKSLFHIQHEYYSITVTILNFV